MENRASSKFAGFSMLMRKATKGFMYFNLVLLLIYMILRGIKFLFYSYIKNNYSESITNNAKALTQGVEVSFTTPDFLSAKYWNDLLAKSLNYIENAHILVISASIVFVTLIVYIASLFVRKHAFGELTPFKDDNMSISIKKDSLVRLELTGLLWDKNLSFLEKEAYQSIKNMSLTVFTLFDTKEGCPRKNINIRIVIPKSQSKVNLIYRKLAGIEQIFQGASKGVFGFGEPRISGDRTILNYSSSSTLLDVKKKDRKKVRKTDKNINSEVSENNVYIDMEKGSFPLSLLEDRSKIVFEQRLKAKEFSEGLKKTLNMYFNIKNIAVSLKKSAVGDTSLLYVYEVKSFKQQDFSLNKELESYTGLSGILVRIEAGELEMTIPLPSKYKVPMDMPTILQEAFSKDENINPTKAFFGRGVDGALITHSINEFPHLLLAGTTGSGKSVLINQIILSMFWHTTPAELQLAIVDPKMVDFAEYENAPHLLSNPITNMEKASEFLDYLVEQMEERYTLFAQLKVKNIDSFNQKVKSNPDFESLAYIVTIIDEFADLIMQNSDIEIPIKRLGAKARACGIHLIVATQDPRVEVLPPLIKSNLPARLSLMVGQASNSNIILDQEGAEKLNKHGDFLNNFNGSNLTRGQAGYISDNEITLILDYLKTNMKSCNKVDFSSDSEQKMIDIKTNEKFRKEIIEDKIKTQNMNSALNSKSSEDRGSILKRALEKQKNK
ncbi:DNA translocase FtsK [Listeria welshimeri]|nr:DNA translocase FtsK [Listeria welshimeri]